MKKQAAGKESGLEPENKGQKINVTKTADKEYIKQMMARVALWKAAEVPGSPKLGLPIAEEIGTLKIEENNGYRRRLIYQEVTEKYPQFFLESSKEVGSASVCIHRQASIAVAHVEKKLKGKEQELEEKIGARHVVDALVKARVPVVGHNCFFDLLHLHEAFFDSLPEHVELWKAEFRKRMPHVFDTKWIAEQSPAMEQVQLTNTALGPMAMELINCNALANLKFELPENYSRYKLVGSAASSVEGSPDHSHEAGYDALMTAQVFAGEIELIAKFKSPETEVPERLGLGTHEASIFLSCRNRLKLMACTPMEVSLDVAESHNFKNTFFMHGFPDTWRYGDVMKVVPVQLDMLWADKTEVWLTTRNDDDGVKVTALCTHDAEGKIQSIEERPFHLLSYGEYVKLRDASMQKSLPASPLSSKKRARSPSPAPVRMSSDKSTRDLQKDKKKNFNKF